ncbi:MAG: flagellar basal body rod protein FlgB [Planctomycetia bacterium]|jgi:flagellar basal-body rod protein FlgB|nr:flagellar basal body rod protein FlgB [Candidatus Brocadia sapporoensis]MCC7240204.1 flagellar basal body rod protein FlgB [Candidatus Brocadia sp.]OQZ03238.1 MAG: flagellar basal-body rod protein FlgB [Candidatus Brocadia sp. UTAMX1]QOJ06880.1 MAG: flagellar basal body rod protein FlgB [Planctomycetia bacterium]RZV56731.1 MAG: flagellar basal body rod protein FlgB [Candidatus Brocadia sp. BROELEC01]TVL96459.1 MAG: flagellar basal body rod protein FlgB [Candidatus Brocadia sp. BL1]TWU54212
MITGTDKSINLLEKMLDVSAIKHKVIANNIANVNTPGYKKMEVSFSDQLEKVIKDTSVDKFDALQPKIVITGKDESVRNDGNNVDMDKEISALMKNTLSYSVFSQLFAKKMELVKTAIENSRV